MTAEVEEKSAFPLIFPYTPDECEICGEVHKFECCSLIGSIVEHIKDTETLPYAQLTLPESLRFQNLHDGRKTVLANKTIPKGVQFGPFIAKTSSIMDMRIDFPIKIFLRDEEKVYLETYEEFFCNWMCLVSPASNYEEQNLFCYQVKTNIYFCTSKDIEKGDELRVWYSPYYAEKMGVQPFAKPPEFIHSSDEEFQEIYFSLQNENVFTSPGKKGQTSPPKKRRKRSKPSLRTKPLSWEHTFPVEPLNFVLPAELLGAKARRKEWQCQTCGHLETNVASYARHLMLHNIPGAKKNLPCPYCPKYFRKDGFHRKVHIETCKKRCEGKETKRVGFVSTDHDTIADPTNLNQVEQENALKISREGGGECYLIFNQENATSTETNMVWDASSIKKLQILGTTISFGEITKAPEQNDTFVEGTLLNEISQPQEIFPIDKDSVSDSTENVLDDVNNDNTDTTKSCLVVEDKTNSEKNLGLESLTENILSKSDLSNPILDLSYDIDFQLTRSLTEMINEDCNLEKSLSLSKNQSLGLFENDQGTSLLEPDISAPQPSSLEPSSYYSLGKTEFLQPNFTACDDVTDEERNRIVENLLSETDDRFLNSDFEMTDGCISENPDSECNNQPTVESDKRKRSPKQSKRGDEFKCDICERGFSKQLYLFRHLRKHTGEFRCNTCLQVFARKETLQSHKSLCVEEQKQKQPVLGAVRLKCSMCRLQFNSLRALDEHMGQHYCKSETWKCACGISSSDSILLADHSCSEKITCCGCKKKFPTKKKFFDHKKYPILRRTRDNCRVDKSLMCEFCGMMFKTANGIRKHRLTTHGENNLECGLCKKKIKRNDTLTLHMKKCHEEPTMECPVCQKQFADESLYKLHYEKTHSPSSFKCKVCDKEFRQKGNLAKHNKSHSSVTYYVCEFCSMKFKNKQNLDYHLLSHHHEDNKTFECTACQKLFATVYQLKRHTRMSHGQMYMCTYCQMTIKYPFKLKKHLAAKHKDKIAEWDSAEAIQAMRQPLHSEETNVNVNEQEKRDPVQDILQTVADSVLQDELLPGNDERDILICDEDMPGQELDTVRQDIDLAEAVEEETQTTLNLLTLNIGSMSAAENTEQIRDINLDDAVVNLPLTVINGFQSEDVSPLSLQQIPISLEIGPSQDDSNVISILNNNGIVNFPLNGQTEYQLSLVDPDSSDKHLEEANTFNFLNMNTLAGDNNGSIVLTNGNLIQPSVSLDNNVILYFIEGPESDSMS